MPDGPTGQGAVVTLVSGSGVPHKAFTNDSGRLDFRECQKAHTRFPQPCPGEQILPVTRRDDS
jgi:hypothetical protein